MIKKEIKPGVIQVTLDESRWYYLEEKPYPSATWILNYWPKGVGFDIYLADKVHSWEQAKQVLREAGEMGGKVHWGIEKYLQNLPVSIHDVPEGDYVTPFTVKEWELILDAVRWREKFKPVVLAIEETVFGDGYAGTADLICDIDTGFWDSKGRLTKSPELTGEVERWIIDWKTSQYIYDSYRAQLAAYAKALDIKNIGIVRLGSKHKVGYEFWTGGEKMIDYYYDLFQTAYTFWKHENPNPAPRIVEIPESLNIVSEDGLPVYD